MAWDVFISHAMEDQAAALALCTTLEAAQIKCWIAPRNITPGMTWPAAISAAIRESRLMLIVFSAYADRSPHMAREVELADRRSMAILPVRIEPVEPTGDLEYFLANRQWIDVDPRNLPERAEYIVLSIGVLLRRSTGQTGSPDAQPQEPVSDKPIPSGSVILDPHKPIPEPDFAPAPDPPTPTTDEDIPPPVDAEAPGTGEQDFVTDNFRRVRKILLWGVLIIAAFVLVVFIGYNWLS